MALAPFKTLTCTGADLPIVVPSPNWPKLLAPHAQTVPSDFRTAICQVPPVMAVTPLRPLTCTGVVLWVVVPSPKPSVFHPHTQTVPSDFRANVQEPPAVTCGVVEADNVPLATAATNKNKTAAMHQDNLIIPFAEANNLFLMVLQSPFR